jgi:hypothetical protein
MDEQTPAAATTESDGDVLETKTFEHENPLSSSTMQGGATTNPLELDKHALEMRVAELEQQLAARFAGMPEAIQVNHILGRARGWAA